MADLPPGVKKYKAGSYAEYTDFTAYLIVIVW